MRQQRLLRAALEAAEAQRTALAAGDFDAYLAAAPASDAASAAVIEAGDGGASGPPLLDRLILATAQSYDLLQAMMDDVAARTAALHSARHATAAYYATDTPGPLQTREG